MTLDTIIAEMRRGCCSAHKLAKEGCATCEPTMRAVEAVRAMAEEREMLVEALRAGYAGLISDGAQWARRNDGLGHQVSMERCHEAVVLVRVLALLGEPHR